MRKDIVKIQINGKCVEIDTLARAREIVMLGDKEHTVNFYMNSCQIMPKDQKLVIAGSVIGEIEEQSGFLDDHTGEEAIKMIMKTADYVADKIKENIFRLHRKRMKYAWND